VEIRGSQSELDRGKGAASRGYQDDAAEDLVLNKRRGGMTTPPCMTNLSPIFRGAFFSSKSARPFFCLLEVARVARRTRLSSFSQTEGGARRFHVSSTVTTASAYDGKISHKCEKLRSITATKPKGAVGSRAPSPTRCGRAD
jgi:hypothetical protein